MTNNNNTPWNGIPDDPDKSGWHWIGYLKRMEPHYWFANRQVWRNDKSDARPFSPELVEYLGPAIPPTSRRRDGTRKVATAAVFDHDYDEISIRMNDGSTYYMNGYYWKDGEPVFEIIGKTIPELIAAAKRYRDPKQEDPAQE